MAGGGNLQLRGSHGMMAGVQVPPRIGLWAHNNVWVLMVVLTVVICKRVVKGLWSGHDSF